MKLVIQTQHYENYAWREDGTLGTGSEAYWKAKGGNEFMVEGVDPSLYSAEEIVDLVRDQVEFSNDGFQSQIVGYGFEQDDYLSWFEKSQLEYDGSITCPEPRVLFGDVMASYLNLDPSYAEESADQDAIYYGA